MFQLFRSLPLTTGVCAIGQMGGWERGGIEFLINPLEILKCC